MRHFLLPVVSTFVLSFCLFCFDADTSFARQDPITKRPSPPQPDDDEENDYTGYANGIVFIDKDNDGIYTNSDSVFSGVKISNGREIVKTDQNGMYSIPVGEESIVFVIKPTGFRTAIGKNKLPKFYYIHKPNGSPKLKYPGSKPTGPINRSIDFPLYRQTESEQFQILLFGDPQPRNIKEVDYITHDVVRDLIGKTSAKFGVSLGDLAFDNLDTLEPLNQSVALIGIPWYNVIGNHDINLDGKTRKHINETFEEIYGPTFYSFNYAQVHFVVLDNIDWRGPSEAIPRNHYTANFGSRQIEFLKKDLSLIPKSQMVVLMMHVPFTNTEDREQIYRLIEDRPLCVSISGHQHFHQHLFLKQKDGWQGKNPHHHLINVTVSGCWWGGQKDERGIPHATMGDGAPNGYSIMSFDNNGYKLDFRAANRPADEQMRVYFPNEVESGQDVDVWVNVYNGSERSKVSMSIAGSDKSLSLEQTKKPDPAYVEIHKLEQQVTPLIEPKMSGPRPSSHLWTAKLPTEMEPGTYLLTVETTDMHDQTFYAQRSFRVKQAITTAASSGGKK